MAMRRLAQLALRLLDPDIERRLRIAEEDVRRYAVHLYVCNARLDQVLQLLTPGEREAFKRGWDAVEPEVLERARAWQREAATR